MDVIPIRSDECMRADGAWRGKAVSSSAVVEIGIESRQRQTQHRSATRLLRKGATDPNQSCPEHLPRIVGNCAADPTM